MLQQLKAVDLERIDIDDAVALHAFGTGLASNFKAHKMPVPEWLQEKNEGLEREISDRRRDMLTRELKNLETRRNELRTADEKRKELDTRMDDIRKALAG